jgi:hypothetical protein
MEVAMPDACCSVPEAGSSTCELRVVAPRGACPTNGKIGKLIDSLTLKAMLAKPLTELRPMEYRFCKDSDCPTVYYSVDGLQTFVEADLRERVYQKRQQDREVFICYCFGHKVGDVLSEVTKAGGAAVIEKINAGIQAGQCACDIRNPQGSCCLGNVRALVKTLTAAV